MAQTGNFKSYLKPGVGTSNSTVYNPTTANIQSTVIGMSVCNIANTPVEATVLLYQSSTANTCHILKEAIVPVGSSIVPVGGDQKLVLNANDSIIVYSNTAASVDVVLSVLEITD